MRKFRMFSVILCFTLLLTGVLAGCSDKTAIPERTNTKIEKFTKDIVTGYRYNPPAVVSTFRFYGPQVKFIKGEDIDNNIWTRAYEEYCGIKLNSLFSVTDSQVFDTRVNASLATNRLPDIIPVYTTLFFRIAEAGKLQDIKPFYEKYASDPIKEDMEEKAGGLAYETCTYDGELLALAGPPELGGDIFWVRQDWLDNLGLEKPKTMGEIVEVARAFTKNDPDQNGKNDTFGLPLDKNLGTLGGFGAAYGVYRNVWVEDEETGELYFGYTDEKWKPVLQTLKDLHDEGVIDPEFVSKSSDYIKYDYAEQKLGMAIGPGHLPDGNLNEAVEANPKARWINYPIPDAEGEIALPASSTRVTGFVAINKDSIYPESIIFMANLYPQLMLGIGQEYQKYHDFVDETDGQRYDSFFYPLIGMGMPSDHGTQCSKKVIEALKTDNPDFSGMTGEQIGYYERCKPWAEDNNPIGWRMYGIFGEGGSVQTTDYIRNNLLVYPDRFWDRETPAWVQNGPDLFYKSNEYMATIIAGKYSVEEGWQHWMEIWKSSGGETCHKEVNEWWQNKGRKGFRKLMKAQEERLKQQQQN